MFSFEWPWFSLLIIVPFICYKLLPEKKAKIQAVQSVFHLLLPPILKLQSINLLNQKNKSSEEKENFTSFTDDLSGKYRQNIFMTFLFFSWLFLILSLMRPQLVNQYTYVEQEGYDIMLAVDISSSMRALDFSKGNKQINRLDITKEVVSKFVRDRKGDRIALVLFGEYAYLHVPLTLDNLSISYMLRHITPGMAGDATSIGDAIALSVANLRSKAEKSRIIIVLTDGEDTKSKIAPLEAAKLAKKYGIRIYTIAVGKNGAVPYPDPVHGIIMVEMPVDEKLLKNIALETGGEYFFATDSNALQRIYDTINNLEKTKSEANEYLIVQSLYRYPLAISCIFFLFASLFPLFIALKERNYRRL